MAPLFPGLKLLSGLPKALVYYYYSTYLYVTYSNVSRIWCFYADDNIPHSTNKNLNKVLQDLDKDLHVLFSNVSSKTFWKLTPETLFLLQT